MQKASPPPLLPLLRSRLQAEVLTLALLGPAQEWSLTVWRRARNSFEYPSTETPGPSEDDVKDAIRVAREVNDAADKILESGILSPW